ncbi:MAG: M48 family metalloprotease [Vicinamibacterales bacterium]
MARIALALTAWLLLVLLASPAGAQAAAAVEVAAQAAAPAASTAGARHQLHAAARDALQKAEALYRTNIAMLLVGTVYGFGMLVLLLVFRVAPRFRDIAERCSQRRFVQVLVFAPLFLLTMDVLGLPLSLYQHSLGLRYGLSVQGWGSWFWDWTKGEIIGTAIATLLVWGLYAVLRRSRAQLVVLRLAGPGPIVLLLILIAPIYIAPLFDTFTSLEEKQPQRSWWNSKVLQRGGVQIERSRMFEMAASDKVTTYSAYVTGIGASKRVVVWDNTSRDMRMDETMFVFGHEIEHYVLQHMWLSLGAAVAALLLQLYLAHRLIDGLLALRRALGHPRAHGLGVAAGADPAAERVRAHPGSRWARRSRGISSTRPTSTASR